jgi:hypothetical protein
MARATDAPGLKRKLNTDGSFRFYWEARTDLAKRGYRPAAVRLHYPDTHEGRLQMAARCRILWAEMLSWVAHDGALPARGYDGTIRSLCTQYETHNASPHRRVKWNTRRAQAQNIKVITSTVGARQIRCLIGPDFLNWHQKWGAPAADGKPPRPWRAKHAMDTLRCVISFGVTLGYEDCMRADLILGKMRFDTPAARKGRMTADHAVALCETAHAMGYHSIALATAIQFETALRQKDVIGEWLPDDSASGGITYKGHRWANGLTWADIDINMILRKRTTKTGEDVEHDLRLCPLVLAELDLITPDKRLGPVIVSESTGEPYKHRTFTQTWRRIADAAGLPKEVWNMHARAGAVSEAYEAGAVETDVMKMAAHRNRQTSAHYNRGSLVQTSRVHELRLAKRTENKQ